jgi:hypothetical protein
MVTEVVEPTASVTVTVTVNVSDFEFVEPAYVTSAVTIPVAESMEIPDVEMLPTLRAPVPVSTVMAVSDQEYAPVPLVLAVVP